jgi:hypothetical protein
MRYFDFDFDPLLRVPTCCLLRLTVLSLAGADLTRHDHTGGEGRGS